MKPHDRHIGFCCHVLYRSLLANQALSLLGLIVLICHNSSVQVLFFIIVIVVFLPSQL
jgi:hypothetical protein